MSQQNVEAVRAVYEQWSEGHFRAAVELFDPYVVLVLRPGFLDAGAYFGAEAVAEYTRGLLGAVRDLTMEAEELVTAGDSVLAEVHQGGVGSKSGLPIEARYFTVWSFRGGKVIRIESFLERADALEAAGLRE